MPIQDDIDDANLGRLEREARRQKRLAQQAPTVQYMGTDGATGQVRVISGSGAASVRVANHSNTQPRPGDIKRGFAGGFDRGNVRRAVGIIPPRKPKETGNTRVLCLSNNQFYVGGHVEDPMPTGIFLPQNAFSIQAFIENVGNEDNDHIVTYSCYTSQTNRVVGGFDGRTNQAWQINAADARLIYKGYGVFTTDNIALPDALIVPGTNTTTITEAYSLSGGGLLFPTYLQTGGEVGSTETRTFTGNGQFIGVITPGVTIQSHSYYQQNIQRGCIIPYGSQNRNTVVRNSIHTSSTFSLRVSSAGIEKLTGSQTYTNTIDSMSGSSKSQDSAFTYDDYITGYNTTLQQRVGTFPVAAGISDVFQGTKENIYYSVVVPSYEWQYLIEIPANYGSATGTNPALVQYPPSGFPPTTTISSATETTYEAMNNIREGYYYRETRKIDSNPETTKNFLSGQGEVNFRLLNSEIATKPEGRFRYTFSSEATFQKLVTVNGLLDYENTATYKAELKSIPLPNGYQEWRRVPILDRLELLPI